jgi:hypothetical protein
MMVQLYGNNRNKKAFINKRAMMALKSLTCIKAPRSGASLNPRAFI